MIECACCAGSSASTFAEQITSALATNPWMWRASMDEFSIGATVAATEGAASAVPLQRQHSRGRSGWPCAVRYTRASRSVQLGPSCLRWITSRDGGLFAGTASRRRYPAFRAGCGAVGAKSAPCECACAGGARSDQFRGAARHRRCAIARVRFSPAQENLPMTTRMIAILALAGATACGGGSAAKSSEQAAAR